jgi:hypothetical protein
MSLQTMRWYIGRHGGTLERHCSGSTADPHDWGIGGLAALLGMDRVMPPNEFWLVWSWDGQSFQALASTEGGDVGRTGLPISGTSFDLFTDERIVLLQNFG